MSSEPNFNFRPLSIAVLLSGSGSTLQNLIQKIAARQLNARIVQVIASKPGIGGIEKAKQANLPVQIIERKAFASIEEFSSKIFTICESAQTELVCLAGYLQLLQIPDAFHQKVINIHPSLLPAFGGAKMYGHHVHQAVLAFGAKISGCTVHFADNIYDHGPIILQRTVPVLDNDTPETLAKRVFVEECIAFPEAINLIAEQRISIQGRLVRRIC